MNTLIVDELKDNVNANAHDTTLLPYSIRKFVLAIS